MPTQTDNETEFLQMGGPARGSLKSFAEELPTVLKKNGDTKAFDITNRRHSRYEELLPEWKFMWTSYQGGKKYRDEQLFQFVSEMGKNFQRRKDEAFNFQYDKKIVDAYFKYIFKNKVEREGFEGIPKDNIDGKGSDMTAFMKKVAVFRHVFNKFHILIDSPKAPRNPETGEPIQISEAERVEMGLEPFAVLIFPWQLIDFYKVGGKFQWALIVTNEVNKANPFTDDKEVEVFNLWTPLELIKFVENENKDLVVIDRVIHGLGEVPLIDCTFEQTDEETQFSLGDYYKLATINRTIFNLVSLINQNLFTQTFGQLVLAEGMDPEVTGVHAAFTEPVEGTGQTRYIQPKGENVIRIWEMIKNYRIEMYFVSGLFKKSDQQLAETAESKSWDFVETEKFLGSIADELMIIEKMIAQFVLLWKSDTLSERFKTEYNKDYQVADLEAELKNLLDIEALEVKSDTFTIEVLKKTVAKFLPNIPSETETKIIKEFEKSLKSAADPVMDTSGENVSLSGERE